MVNQSRPVVLQQGEAPIFIGKGAEVLCCRKCGALLVDKFEQGSLIAIDLQCSFCGTLTTTPKWESNKPLPHAVIALSDTAKFLVRGPLELGKKACLSGEHEIKRIEAATQSSGDKVVALDITPEGLKNFISGLDLVAGCRLSRELGEIRRHRGGAHPALKSCLAWAVSRLEAQVKIKQLDLSDEEGVALNYLHIANHVFRSWSSHFLISDFSRGLVDDFHHNATMLMVASYLEKHGNRIGFSDVSDEKGPSPDLYIDLNRVDRVSIEVKAPQKIQWPARPTKATLEKSVFDQVRSAKRQITGSAGGVVVIGSSAVSEPLEFVIHDLAKRNRFSSRVAAVVAVSYPAAGQFQALKEGVLAANCEARIVPIRNPNFRGENFLKI